MKQPIIKIVEAIDGSRVFKECGLGLAKCSEARLCPIHHEYKKSRDLAEKLFNSKKIADLCGSVNGGIAYLL